MKNSKVAYLVGPMSNIENKNHELFNVAEALLMSLGFIVISPAKLPVGLSYNAYIEHAQTSVKCCDFIFQLPESEKSQGARFLTITAGVLGKPVFNKLQDIPGKMYEPLKPFAHNLIEKQKEISEFRKKILFKA